MAKSAFPPAALAVCRPAACCSPQRACRRTKTRIADRSCRGSGGLGPFGRLTCRLRHDGGAGGPNGERTPANPRVRPSHRLHSLGVLAKDRQILAVGEEAIPSVPRNLLDDSVVRRQSSSARDGTCPKPRHRAVSLASARRASRESGGQPATQAKCRPVVDPRLLLCAIGEVLPKLFVGCLLHSNEDSAGAFARFPSVDQRSYAAPPAKIDVANTEVGSRGKGECLLQSGKKLG